MYLCFSISLVICNGGIYGTDAVLKVAPHKTAKHEQSKFTFANRPFIIYLIITSLFYGITNINSTFLPAMFQSEGIAIDPVSTILFLLTLSELPIIFFSNKFMDQFSNKKCS